VRFDCARREWRLDDDDVETFGPDDARVGVFDQIG
jgi:hypothetical protein